MLLENYSGNVIGNILQDFYVAQIICNMEYAIAEVSNNIINEKALEKLAIEQEKIAKQEDEERIALQLKDEERKLEIERRQKVSMTTNNEKEKIDKKNDSNDIKNSKLFNINTPIISSELAPFIVKNTAGLLALNMDINIINDKGKSAIDLINDMKSQFKKQVVESHINKSKKNNHKHKATYKYQANMNIINGEFRLSSFDLIKYKDNMDIFEMIIDNLINTGVREKVRKSNGSISNKRNTRNKNANRNNTNRRRSA